VDLTREEPEAQESPVSAEELETLIQTLEEQMRAAAREFAFEKAAQIRDRIRDLRQKLLAS
jgi:excinuclease ABC subunit B